jgi:hypothetical protein
MKIPWLYSRGKRTTLSGGRVNSTQSPGVSFSGVRSDSRV